MLEQPTRQALRVIEGTWQKWQRFLCLWLPSPPPLPVTDMFLWPLSLKCLRTDNEDPFLSLTISTAVEYQALSKKGSSKNLFEIHFPGLCCLGSVLPPPISSPLNHLPHRSHSNLSKEKHSPPPRTNPPGLPSAPITLSSLGHLAWAFFAAGCLDWPLSWLATAPRPLDCLQWSLSSAQVRLGLWLAQNMSSLSNSSSAFPLPYSSLFKAPLVC